MKLIRWGNTWKEKTGIIINDKMYDTSSFGGDYNEQFFENDGIKRLEAFLRKNEGKVPQIRYGERLGSPIARPSKIICISLNYAKHALVIGKKTSYVDENEAMDCIVGYCLHNDVSEREFQLEPRR